jgi:hypothetical protein
MHSHAIFFKIHFQLTFLILKKSKEAYEITVLKPGILEPEETAVIMQRLGKHIPTATDTHATIEELLDAVFSVRLVPKGTLNL